MDSIREDFAAPLNSQRSRICSSNTNPGESDRQTRGNFQTLHKIELGTGKDNNNNEFKMIAVNEFGNRIFITLDYNP
jgi:hypothetical protein